MTRVYISPNPIGPFRFQLCKSCVHISSIRVIDTVKSSEIRFSYFCYFFSFTLRWVLLFCLHQQYSQNLFYSFHYSVWYPGLSVSLYEVGMYLASWKIALRYICMEIVKLRFVYLSYLPFLFAKYMNWIVVVSFYLIDIIKKCIDEWRDTNFVRP